MPLYEYYCTDCQTKFETLRPMSQANDPIQCKNCESMHTSRTLSLFAAHIKGSTSLRSAALSGGGCSGGSCSSCGGGCSCGCH